MIIPFTKYKTKETKRKILTQLGVNNDFIDSLENFRAEWERVMSSNLLYEIEDELEIVREQNDELYQKLADIEKEELLK